MTAVAAKPAETSDNKTISSQLEVNSRVFEAIVDSTQKGLGMTGVKAHCAGVSRVPGRQHGELTSMIGVHGKVSGFFTVNMSQRLAAQALEGLLGDRYDELSPALIDGAGELANMIVGGVKSTLTSTEWAFSSITVPSVIVGDGYQVAFARGLELLDVTFEVENAEAVTVSDRMLHVSMSLLKL